MSHLLFDKDGVLLADVPGSGVSTHDANAKSGNPRHDTRSGKFGSGGGDKPARFQTPQEADPLEFGRMVDAVKDAARQFDDFDEGDAQEFLKARAKDPSVVDMQQFLDMVRQQHISDLVDILDSQLRGAGVKPFGRRTVKVSAPRGYLRRAVTGLSDDELAQVMHRLEAKGIDQDAIDNYFDKRRPANGDAKGKRDAIAASGKGFTFEAADPMEDAIFFQERENEERDSSVALAITLAEKIAANIKMPDVRVEPHITVEAPPDRPKKVIRDERGFISEVITDGTN